MMVATLDPQVRDDKAVKIERRIVEEAGRIALHRGITMAEYLSDILREAVHGDYLAAIEAEYKAAMGEPKAPRRKRGES